jgi:hypothetical protein
MPGQPTSATNAQDQRAEFDKYWETLPRFTVPVPSGGAAVLIVKFTDFQCPVCGTTHRDYKPILERYQAEVPGAVKVVSKMYHLQPGSKAPRPFHSAAATRPRRGSCPVPRAAPNHGGLALPNQALSSLPSWDGARPSACCRTCDEYPRVLRHQGRRGLPTAPLTSTPTFIIHTRSGAASIA